MTVNLIHNSSQGTWVVTKIDIETGICTVLRL
jgi:hypothetical protein